MLFLYIFFLNTFDLNNIFKLHEKFYKICLKLN